MKRIDNSHQNKPMKKGKITLNDYSFKLPSQQEIDSKSKKLFIILKFDIVTNIQLKEVQRSVQMRSKLKTIVNKELHKSSNVSDKMSKN